MYVCVYIYIYIYMYVSLSLYIYIYIYTLYIYIYMEREIERERERERDSILDCPEVQLPLGIPNCFPRVTPVRPTARKPADRRAIPFGHAVLSFDTQVIID